MASSSSEPDDQRRRSAEDDGDGGGGEAADDYGQLPKNQSSSPTGSTGTRFSVLAEALPEPADPPPRRAADLPNREDAPLASDNYDATDLPRPFQVCGCGDCFSVFGYNPAYGCSDTPMAADICDDPRPMTVGEAADAYRQFALNEIATDGWTDKLLDARNRYRRIMEADRRLVREYDLTTVLLSLRLSPTTREDDDVADGWHPPLRLDGWLHEAWSSVRSAFDYRISDKLGLDYEYVAVTAGTDPRATPHRHVLLWIDDPDDAVTGDLFSGVLNKHVEQVPTAYTRDHEATDGRGGCVSVSTDPPLVPSTADGWASDDPRKGFGTLAAQYVGAQLPHLDALGDVATVIDAADGDGDDGGTKFSALEAALGEGGAGGGDGEADDYDQSRKSQSSPQSSPQSPSQTDDQPDQSEEANGAYIPDVAAQTAAIAWCSSYDWFTSSANV